MECNNGKLQWSGTRVDHFYLPFSPFSHYWCSPVSPDACLSLSLNYHIITVSHSLDFPQISYNKFPLALNLHGNLVPTFLSVTKFWLKLVKALSGSCNIPSINNMRALVFVVVSIFSCSFGVGSVSGFLIYCFLSWLLSQSFRLKSL